MINLLAGHFCDTEAWFVGIQCHFHDQCITWNYWFSPLDPIYAAEEKITFSIRYRLLQHDDAGHLSQRFDLQDAGHDGSMGKVTCEVRFVDGDVLDSDGSFAGLERDDAIDEKERVAMWKDFHDVINRHDGGPGGGRGHMTGRHPCVGSGGVIDSIEGGMASRGETWRGATLRAERSRSRRGSE